MLAETSELELTSTSTGLRLVRRNEALVEQVCRGGSRPYLHPIRSPEGGVLLTEDEPDHHPWQHGLYTGLNGVNGVGFWTEGLFGDKAHRASDGRIECEACSAGEADWSASSQWIDPERRVLLRDQMRWTYQMRGSTLVLDLDWRLTAVVDCEFQRYAYGGLFLRMPVDETCDNASLLTSNGSRRREDADGRQSRWMALDVRDGDQQGGICIIDHPSNGSEPVPWRVDGEMGIGPSPCISGAWSLRESESRTFRYRILVYDGPADAQRIDHLVPGELE
jgi:hypothetical protein